MGIGNITNAWILKGKLSSRDHFYIIDITDNVEKLADWVIKYANASANTKNPMIGIQIEKEVLSIREYNEVLQTVNDLHDELQGKKANNTRAFTVIEGGKSV